MFKARFAGARLAANPLVDVKDQLLIAQQKLKNLSAETQAERGSNAPSFAESKHDSFVVPGTKHRVSMDANARPFSLEIGDLNAEQYLGDKETFRMLAEKPPKTEYSLSWSVDGSYSDPYNSDMGPAERLRIARETQRHWTKLIGGLEDGAIVSNSPVGAGEGNFGRADLYMANGFGPVQTDGQMYGQVRNGKIIPINPIGVDQEHGKHLAKKVRMAGDVGLSDEMLKQLSMRQDVKTDDKVQMARDSKGWSGSYQDDYNDDYYDDDYTPPFDRFDVKNSAFYNQGDIQDPVQMRRVLEDDRAYAGFDLEETPEIASGRREFPGEDVEAFRQMQINAAMDEGPGLGAVQDAFNRNFPRPLPSRLESTSELRPERRRRNDRRTVTDIDRLQPEQRREALIETIRTRLDRQRAARSGGPAIEQLSWRDRNLPAKQASIKETMIDGVVDDDANAVIQMLFDQGDVQAAREVQEAAARAGLMTPDWLEMGRAPRRGYGRNPEPTGTGRGLEGEVVDLPAGTNVVERRALTADQAVAQQRLDRLDERGVQDERNIQMMMSWMPEAEAEAFLRRVSAAAPSNPGLSERQVSTILDRAGSQPGRASDEEIGAAINQYIYNSNRNANVVEPELNALLAEAEMGPAAPIRRNPMAPDQMEVEVPGVGTLRRPNPFVPSVEELISPSARLQPDERVRRGARVMDTVPQGAGDEFDDLSDLSPQRSRSRIAETPALQRGPRVQSEYEAQRRENDLRNVFGLPPQRLTPARRRDNRRPRARRRPQQFDNSAPQIQVNTAPPLPEMIVQPRLPQAPRGQTFIDDQGFTRYEQPSLRENLEFQDQLVSAFNNSGERIVPQFDIGGRPVLDLEQIQRAGFGQDLTSLQQFTREHNIVQPINVEGPVFSSPAAAARARGEQEVDVSRAPRDMSFTQFREWRNRELERQAGMAF